MMKMFRSRAALVTASLAVVAMTATPASARHWRHRDRIDTGDVLAGLLVIGGIAAVASAASKSNRDRQARDYRYPDRYPDADYRDNRDYRDSEGRYGAPRSEENYAGGYGSRDSGNIDGAVNACLGEVERGERQVDTVEGVNRASDGWRVDGRLRDGRAFSCTTGPDARIRSATVDGRALT